ncbi:type I 3-dehydroquinase-domain-containing protein [Xylaria cf. heliscus]|nr:type I 3-dehydroquinase-domain-containing protein [Xylaria cf. heliscus]
MEVGSYVQDASIVLTGIRGTGRSTLALLAANHLGFNIIDTDIIFRQAFGITDRAYALKYGQEECCRQQLILMRSALDSNPVNAVIVCGLTSIVRDGQRLLKDYCKAHPVIYIIRDAEEVSKYLQHRDVAAISSIIDAASPTFRSISNFEFYNLPDTAFTNPGESTEISSPPSPSLVMKKAEFDFLELLSFASGQLSPLIGLARTLTSLAPLEARPYTYALVLTASQIATLGGKLRELDSMADAVELVIDVRELLGEEPTLSSTKATWISRIFYTLRRNVRLPIIYHVRYANKQSMASSSLYLDVVRHGLRIGSDFVTVDLRLGTAVQELLVNQSRSKLIGNFHDDFPESGAWDSEARRTLLEESARQGFDIIRFTQRATSDADNISIQRFIRHFREVCRAGTLLVAYNTGPLGRISCYRNRILTPVTHPLISACNSTPNCDDNSDGIPSVPEALGALYDSSVLESYYFGVFGPDVHLSIAPFLHNSAFSYCGMPHEYKTFQGPSLEAFESTLRDTSFGGGSITRRFKTEVIPLLDYLSPAATAIGAVNTVIPLRSRETDALLDREKRGKVVALYGENTDWIAIHTCIRRNLSPINAMKGRSVGLVLGAGGTAHAAVYSMVYLGVKKIYVWNRTMENAEKMAHRFSEKTFAMSDSRMAKTTEFSISKQKFGPSKVIVIPSKEHAWPTLAAPPNIIVSCIPYPDFQIHDEWLSSKTGGICIELSYTPLETPLLAQVRKLAHRRWITNDGMVTFPEQAIAQFELFTGRKAPRNLMRSLCYSRYLDKDDKS